LEPIKLEKENENIPLSPLHEYAATTFKNPEHAQNFVNWFGNSKVTDASGKPLKVYHGASEDFDTFSNQKSKTSDSTEGFWMSSNPDEANEYSFSKGEYKGIIIPTYLNINSPYIVDAKNKNYYDPLLNKQAIEEAKKRKHDGVIIKNYSPAGHKGDYYFVFHPHQIKSALANQGGFNPTNPNIKLSKQALKKGKEKLLRLAKFTPLGGTLVPPKQSEDYSKPFPNALLQSISGQNSAHKAISKAIAAKLGIPIDSKLGVAESEDGSTHAIVSHLNAPVDEQTLSHASSWMGLQSNQKSVLTFFPIQNGKDSLYYLESPETDLKKLRQLIASHGFSNKVIIPSPKKTGIYIYDQNRAMRNNLNQLANTLNTDAIETVGSGKFLGHEGDPNAEGARPKARQDYRENINATSPANSESNQDTTPTTGSTDDNRGASRTKEPAKQFQRDIRNRYKLDRARRVLEGLIRHHNSPNKELPPVQDLISADLTHLKPEHIEKYQEIIPNTNWDEISGAIGSLQNDPSLYADLTAEHNRKGMYQREHARQVLNTPGLHQLMDMLVSGDAIPEHIMPLVDEAKDGDYYALQAISKELGDSIPSLMAYCKAAEKAYNKAGNMWDKTRTQPAKFSKHLLRVGGGRDEIHYGQTIKKGQFRPKSNGEKALQQVQLAKGNNMHSCIKRFLTKGDE